MNSQKAQTRASTPADEDVIRAIHRRMIDAWNAGDGAAFAASFTDGADFVVWDGTHVKGRQQIASFTQRIFDTVVKGSRFEGEVNFVRFLSPVLAVMHSEVRVTLPGQTTASPGQLFKHGKKARHRCIVRLK
jgi:uncharacterized protein (TIGR02246 family)